MPNKLSQFWLELKRRNVVRVITVYAGAAFVIIELINNITEPLKLPEWTPTLVIVLLAIGFPIAIIFSWIYDIHPEEGVVKTEAADKVKVEEIPKISNGWKIASYISFVVIVGLIVLNVIPRTGKKKILDKSIVVLPFTNMSTDEENTYFIDGVMESILDNLCKIKDLRVPGRTSVIQYRDNPKPISIVAEEMDVAYVLEGSGQKIGNRLLLTVQLIIGDEDRHIWSKQYDRVIEKVEDLIDIQKEIAQLVANEIEVIITPEEKQRIEKLPTTSLTALDFCLLGTEKLHDYWLGGDSITLVESENCFRRALDYDSTFAQAYTGLAWIYGYKHFWKEFLTETFLDSALILTDIALSFNDQLAEAYVLRGLYYSMNNQKEQAINEYDKAIKFNPNYWEAYRAKGQLYSNDDLVKAIDNLQKAASLHRGSFLPGIYRNIGGQYAGAGFKEKAIYYAKEALKLDDDSAAYYRFLAFREDNFRNYEKAIEFGKKTMAFDSTDWFVIYLLGLHHSFLGQFEESLRYFKEYDRRCKILNEPHPYGTFRIGHSYWVNGFKEEAEYYFNTGLEFHNEMLELDRQYGFKILTFYNLATMYAFLGDKDKTYKNLRLFNQMPRMPLFVVANIKDDPLFDSIRDEPEFQQIVRDVEAKYQAEHERVRQWLEANDML